jgi:hypothetical protein
LHHRAALSSFSTFTFVVLPSIRPICAMYAAVVAGPNPDVTGEIPSSDCNPRRSPYMVDQPVSPVSSNGTQPATPPYVAFSQT